MTQRGTSDDALAIGLTGITLRPTFGGLEIRQRDGHAIYVEANDLAEFKMAVAGGSPTQAQTLEWVRERWPDRTDPMWRALKLGEEAGEVQGAVVKMTEGRKTLADLGQETAQLVICAMALAESAGFDLQSEITAEWERNQ